MLSEHSRSASPSYRAVVSSALSPEESRVHAELSAGSPALARAFLGQLAVARLAISEWLLQALLRGGFMPASRVMQGRAWIRVRLLDGSDIVAPVARRETPEGFELAGPLTLFAAETYAPLDRPQALWRALLSGLPAPGVSEEAASRFAHELDESVVSYALALAGAAKRLSGDRAV